jgi:predicted enzyme related to lactoylglutathione lyase
VPSLARSLKACVAQGGKILRPAKTMGGAKMAVICDPAGAVAALYQAPKAPAPAKKKR